MKTKKILAAIAALTIVCGAVPTQPFADVIGNMAITASAETSEADFEFDSETGTITRYTGSETEVVIPSAIDGVTVKSIGDSVFKLYYLLSLTFEENSQLESIGDSAFSGCSLKSITLPDSVTEIGKNAFNNCSALKSITIPDSVTSIGYGAFFGCESLENITAPCRLKGDESIYEVVEKNDATVTWSHVFAEDSDTCECDEKVKRYITGNCGANAAYVFDKATGKLTISGTGAVKGSAFDAELADEKEKKFASEIKEVVIGDGITEIDQYAFYDCSSLETVEMNSVTSIDYGAFHGCSSLADIKAPCKVKWNESDWKAGCNATVTYNHTFAEGSDTCVNGDAIKRDGVVFEKCGDNAYYSFDKATGTLTISGTGAIEVSAFDHDEFDWVTAIKEVVIGDGITEIDQYAFYDCSSLETVEMNSVTSIDYGAFYGCSSLTSVTLGSTVPDGLLDSYIPDTVKLIIPAEAYENYKNLGYELGFSDIKGIGYILEGQIGIRLATDLSADNLAVMCGEKAIDLTQKTGYVEFYVAAQDMAKEYTVYYVDGENNIEIAKFNPKNSLAGYETTEYKAVANALITYCEAANANFNNGTVEDYSSEWESVKAAIGKNTFNMGENYYGSSLLLKSDTVLRHYYTKNDGTMTAKGDYFYKEESVDPTKFARTDTYSVYDYIYKVLTSNKADANLKNLCVVLYKYGEAAKGYIKHTHTPVTTPAVAPTCKKTGLSEGSHCSECGEILVPQETVDALGLEHINRGDGICLNCGEAFSSAYQYMFEYTPRSSYNVGFDSREMGLLAKEAKKYNCTTLISCTHCKKQANPKDAVKLVELNFQEGEPIFVIAEGKEADEAIVALKLFFEANL